MKNHKRNNLTRRLNMIEQRLAGEQHASETGHRTPMSLRSPEHVNVDVRSSDIVARMEAISARADALLAKAEVAGDLKAAPGILRELQGTIMNLAKLTGELKDGTTVNVAVALDKSPEWITLRARLYEAIGHIHPECRAVIAKALE